jgi:dihydroxyacetone kinase
LCNLAIAAKESKTSVSELLDLLADQTKAPSWPNVLSNTTTKVDRTAAPEVDIEKQTEISPEDDIKGRWPYESEKLLLMALKSIRNS